MSAATAGKIVNLPEPTDEPASVKAKIRGKVYTFTELRMEDYNELMKRATSTEKNSITGEDEEMVDQALLMRLMILAVMKPKPDKLMFSGVRLYRAISKIVNDLHYGEEPVEIIKDEDAEPDFDEGDSQGNG